MNYDVIIVGNGIIGCSIAHLLSKETNLKIALVGHPDRPGSASMAAGAMLNVFGEVDENTLRDDVHKERFELAILATRYWPEWLSSFKQKVDLHHGTNIFHNGRSLDRDRFKLIVQTLKQYNEPFSYVDSVPGLNPKVEPNEIIRIPGEGWVKPSQLFMALEDRLILSKNVDIYHERVVSIDRDRTVTTENDKLKSDKIIVCAGAFTRELLRFLDHNVQRTFFGVGSSMLLNKPDWQYFEQKEVIRTPIRAGACGLITVPYDDHLYLGASSWVVEKPESFPRFASVQHLMNSAVDQINRQLIHTNLIKTFVGMRPVSEDTFPLIGELESNPGIFVVTGTKRDGLHMSPLIARDMVERICFGRSVISDTFRPERSPIRYLTREEGINQAYNAKINYAINHGEKVYPNLFRDQIEAIYDEKGLTYGVSADMLDVS